MSPSPSKPAHEEGPEHGHTFKIRFDSRGSYSVRGQEGWHDEAEWGNLPHEVEVRGWSLRAALQKAACLPFGYLMGEETAVGDYALCSHLPEDLEDRITTIILGDTFTVQDVLDGTDESLARQTAQQIIALIAPTKEI